MEKINMEEILKYPNADWSMPFLFANDLFIPVIHELLGENHKIKYVYGSTRCKWAGGRFSRYDIKNLRFIEKILTKTIFYNTTPVFTFTNTSINEEDISDKFCNGLLKIISELNCQIILVSDLLYDHIKENFPNIKLVSSIIKSTYLKVKDKDETQHINDLTEKFDRVVIRPEFAMKKNFNFTDIKDISKLEILINQNCIFDCPASDAHYRLFELFDKQLINEKNFSEATIKLCPAYMNPNAARNSLNETQIEKLINAGITNLKLQGRNFHFNAVLIELFSYYFKNDINKSELEAEIDKIISSVTKKSHELQLHTFLES